MQKESSRWHTLNALAMRAQSVVHVSLSLGKEAQFLSEKAQAPEGFR